MPRITPMLRIVFTLCALTAAVLMCPRTGQAQTPEEMAKWSDEAVRADRLQELTESMLDTGIGPETIRAIDFPDYASVSDASLVMEADDIVFVVEDGPRVLIIPQSIMVWHEILNETVDGRRASITYCPRTGSVVGFFGQIGSIRTTFGNYGRLLNGNLIMHDRATGSLWSQILGEAIAGPLTGAMLERFPVIWTNWKLAARYYPMGQVLTKATGFKRDYGRDPYGSYHKPDTYYSSNFTYYPLMHKDTRLHPKERMLAMRYGMSGASIQRAAVKERGVINFELGVDFMVAVYDQNLDTVRVYNRTVKGNTLDFIYMDGEFRDAQSGSLWAGAGLCIEGAYEGERLRPAAAFEVMWYAWAAFFPGSRIIE